MRRVVLFLLLIGVLSMSVFSGGALATTNGGKGPGTSLIAFVTSKAKLEMNTSYDWEIQKSANVERPVIKVGESYPITYTLNAVRSAPSTTEKASVSGKVKVWNAGAKATQGLKIVIQVEHKTGSNPYSPLQGAEMTITPTEQLDAWETEFFPYELSFTPEPSGQYRVSAKVTITNHSGQLGVDFGPNPKSDGFTLPSSPVSVTEDETATLNDAFVCPPGFSCVVDKSGPWQLTGNSIIEYILTVTNDSAPEKRLYPLLNTATLTEETTKQERVADEKVLIFTGCPCQAQP